jgi:hypothetical protein
MSLSSTTNRISYSGNGSTTAFSFPYYFLEAGDLKVVLVSSAGAETVQTLTTHYTVTGAGVAAGGACRARRPSMVFLKFITPPPGSRH